MQNSAVLSIAFRYLSLFEVQGVRAAGASKTRMHLRGNKTLVAILGLAIGVCVLMMVLSIVNGFERELRQRILAVVPHVILFHYEGIDDWQTIAEKIRQQGAVGEFNQPLAIAPISSFQALLIHEQALSASAVTGVLPAAEKKVSIIGDLFIEGNLENLQSVPYGIVLASKLADKLNVKMGDKIKLLMPEARVSMLGILPRYRQFEVVGIFEVGAAMDQYLSYIHIDASAKLNRSAYPVSALRLKMPDIFDAAYDAWKIAAFLNLELERQDQPHFWYAKDWTQSQGSLYEIISMTKSMLGLLVLLIVVVACFNLSSSLIMLVNEKRSDIAILMSQGLSSMQVLMIFVLQGFLSALAGLLLGLFMAWIFLAYLGNGIKNLEAWLQVDLTSSYPVHYLPTQILWIDMVVIFFAVILLSFFASLYPAYQATRIKPADELRYD